MAFYSSGNREVDAMGQVVITGNITPPRWYKEILKETGKADRLAIDILADIVYWYRPVEVRDESSGMPVGWKKKFKGDYLQQTYEQYADHFSEDKRAVKAAMDRLEKMGLIKRIFRTLELANGSKVPNVMYIDIFPDMIAKITENVVDSTSGPADQKLGDGDPEFNDSTFGHCVQKLDSETSKPAKTLDSDGGPTNICNTSYKNLYDVPQKSVPYPTKFSNTSHKKMYDVLQNSVPYPTEICRTNTENTTETTKGDYPSIDQGDCKDIQSADQMDQIDPLTKEAMEYKEYIYDRLNYEWHLEHDPYPENEKYAQLVDLVCDEVCGKKKTSFVNRTEMPHEVVKSRLLKLEEGHIEYVRDSLNKNPNHDGIEDLRKYLLTCLYNSPVTIEQFYQQDYNHDKHRGPEL